MGHHLIKGNGSPLYSLQGTEDWFQGGYHLGHTIFPRSHSYSVSIHDGAAFRVANESLLKRSLRIFKSPSGIDTPGYPLHSAPILQLMLAYFKTPNPPQNSLRINIDESIQNIPPLALKEDLTLFWTKATLSLSKETIYEAGWILSCLLNILPNRKWHSFIIPSTDFICLSTALDLVFHIIRCWLTPLDKGFSCGVHCFR